MANLKNVVKVTQAQYDTLKSGGTVSGQTYDANNIYLVDTNQTHEPLYRLDIQIQMMTNASSIWGEIYTTTFITKSVLDSRSPTSFTSTQILGEGKSYTGYDTSEFLRVLFPNAYTETMPAMGNGYCQTDISRPVYCFKSAESDTASADSIAVISNNGWVSFSATGTSSYARTNIITRCTIVG